MNRLVAIVCWATFLVGCPCFVDAEELISLKTRSDALLTEVTEGRLSYVLNGGGKIQQLPLNQVVRWGHPVEPAARPRVVLRDGSQLVTAPVWRRAGAIELQAGKFAIKLATVEPVEVQRSSVKYLLLEAARDPSRYGDVLRELRHAQQQEGDKDLAWLTGGDRFEGLLEGIKNSQASFSVAGQTIQIALSDLVAIHLAPPNNADFETSSASQNVAVGLKDGTLFKATEVAIEAEKLELTCPLVGTVRGGRSDFLAFLQPTTEAAVYLSDLTPLDYRHTPFTSLTWDYARDANLEGNAIRVAGRRYLKGLAMHSASRLVYRAPPGVEKLVAELAVASPEGRGQGSVVFRVLVARASGFEQVYESPIIRDSDQRVPLSLDIAGARAIALLVDYADRGDQGDHAFWLDARLIRATVSPDQ